MRVLPGGMCHADRVQICLEADNPEREIDAQMQVSKQAHTACVLRLQHIPIETQAVIQEDWNLQKKCGMDVQGFFTTKDILRHGQGILQDSISLSLLLESREAAQH
jgi:hypothetical protein